MIKIVEILKAIITHSKSEVVYQGYCPEISLRSSFIGAYKVHAVLNYDGHFDELIKDVEDRVIFCATDCYKCELDKCTEKDEIKDEIINELNVIIDANIEYLTTFKESLKTFKLGERN